MGTYLDGVHGAPKLGSTPHLCPKHGTARRLEAEGLDQSAANGVHTHKWQKAPESTGHIGIKIRPKDLLAALFSIASKPVRSSFASLPGPAAVRRTGCALGQPQQAASSCSPHL